MEDSPNGVGEFGKELLGIFHDKKRDIMARPQVTEFEEDDPSVRWAGFNPNKYGEGVILEHKGQFRLERTNSEDKENQASLAPMPTAQSCIHPSLLKKEYAQQNEAGLFIKNTHDRAKPTEHLRHCRGQVVRAEETPRPQQSVEAAPAPAPAVVDEMAYMKELSDGFEVNEEAMKFIMNGEEFPDEHFNNEVEDEFKTPASKKKNEASNTALRRLSQAVKNKVDKTKRRSSMVLEATAKRLSISTPKFMKRTRSGKEKCSSPQGLKIADFEVALQGLQTLYPDQEREILKDLLTKSGGNLERAIELYRSQQIKF